MATAAMDGVTRTGDGGAPDGVGEAWAGDEAGDGVTEAGDGEAPDWDGEASVGEAADGAGAVSASEAAFAAEI